MKKAFALSLLASFVVIMLAAPVLADLPDTYTSTDPDELYAIDIDSLTEDELRTAYSALRDTYAACFQALIDEHAKGLTGGEDSDPEPIPIINSIWEVRYYTDEFQQPTDQAYIGNIDFLKGTFSNTATTNSELLAVVYAEKKDVSIKLLEYGDHVVKGYHSDGQNYGMSILIDGEKTVIGGKLKKGSSRIRLMDEYTDFFLDALKSGKEIKVYISGDSSTYLFTIPASSGFAELYDSTFEQ